MFKVIATNVVISKGFDNAPALKFSEKGDFVRFRIGKKVYDPNAENNSRWINLSVKAFNRECERIRNMKLKEGSFLNLIGRLDEDVWTDEGTGQTRSAMVIILDEVEYAGGGRPKENSQEGHTVAAPQGAATQTADIQELGNFTGYEPFGGSSFFS